MTHRQAILGHVPFYLCGQLQETQRVGDGGTVLAYPLCQFFLGEAEPLKQGIVGFRLLNRIEILPLNIFDEGHFQGIKTVKGESTSYTVAICIPGIDRFYLHHCGANDTFGYDDVDFSLIERSKPLNDPRSRRFKLAAGTTAAMTMRKRSRRCRR